MVIALLGGQQSVMYAGTIRVCAMFLTGIGQQAEGRKLGPWRGEIEMGWGIGFDEHWQRDIGYSVPAHCDYPGCRRVIDRGLSYVCGGEPYGGDTGCGLYFCGKHHGYYLETADDDAEDVPHSLCERCAKGKKPFDAKPDHKKWTHWKMTHWSWAEWRKENGHPEPKRMRKRDDQ